jgi:long-chain acyl-CoA synthetase
MPKRTRLDPTLDTVPKLFHSQVSRFGDRVAMREKVLGVWQETSWNQYLENVQIVGSGLLALGVVKGECVSIISENNPEWLYCDIGTQCIGGITVGIYPTNSAEEVAYIINHSETRVFFLQDEEQLDKFLLTTEELVNLSKVIVYDMEGLRQFEDDMHCV